MENTMQKSRKQRTSLRQFIPKTDAQKKGQFFTTHTDLHDQMYAFIQNQPDIILEPSVGRGDLVIAMTQRYTSDSKPVPSFVMFEIDSTVPRLPELDSILERDKGKSCPSILAYSDFIDSPDDDVKYTTIIGNPPYVRITSAQNKLRQKKQGTSNTECNLYLLFIRKCVSLLCPGGELIFIVPSDFFHRTWSAKVITDLLLAGRFTDIFRPESDRLFGEAGIDVIIFRYQLNGPTLEEGLAPSGSMVGTKNDSRERDLGDLGWEGERSSTWGPLGPWAPDLNKKIMYNNEERQLVRRGDHISFQPIQQKVSVHEIGDIFNVGVGLASGRESILRNEELGNLRILNGQNRWNRYIFIDPVYTDPLCNIGDDTQRNQQLNQKGWEGLRPSLWVDLQSTPTKVQEYLIEHKEQLISRKFRRFGEDNWYEWEAARNSIVIIERAGQPCVYVYMMRRNGDIAFSGKVECYGAQLIMLVPKCPVSFEADMALCNATANFMNSETFRAAYTFSGRFCISQRQLTSAPSN